MAILQSWHLCSDKLRFALFATYLLITFTYSQRHLSHHVLETASAWIQAISDLNLKMNTQFNDTHCRSHCLNWQWNVCNCIKLNECSTRQWLNVESQRRILVASRLRDIAFWGEVWTDDGSKTNLKFETKKKQISYMTTTIYQSKIHSSWALKS